MITAAVALLGLWKLYNDLDGQVEVDVTSQTFCAFLILANLGLTGAAELAEYDFDSKVVDALKGLEAAGEIMWAFIIILPGNQHLKSINLGAAVIALAIQTGNIGDALDATSIAKFNNTAATLWALGCFKTALGQDESEDRKRGALLLLAFIIAKNHADTFGVQGIIDSNQPWSNVAIDVGRIYGITFLVRESLGFSLADLKFW